jgi:hypothetical protein
MRQAKSWEAIGISRRASWYRRGKPTEKPERTSVAAAARAAGVCLRTQRIVRVIAVDVDVAMLMMDHGWRKPEQAEAIIKNGRALVDPAIASAADQRQACSQAEPMARTYAPSPPSGPSRLRWRSYDKAGA